MPWLLLACADAPAPERVNPTPWNWEVSADAGDPLDQDELEEGIRTVVDLVRAASPREVLDAYEATLALGDSECPLHQEHNGQDYVTADCTTGDGDGFWGFGLSVRLADLYMEGSQFHRHWEWYTGTFRVAAGDGTTLSISGDALYRAYDTPEGAYSFAGELVGEFQWSGPSVPADAWAATPAAIDLHLDTSRAAAPGENTFWLAGAASDLPSRVVAFRTDELRWDDPACAEEPVGRLELVTDELAWLGVEFDGDCDGCGAVDGDGTTADRACADWSALVAWGESPW